MSKPCYIFDLDGTLADVTHRLPLIQTLPGNRRAFLAACPNDAPIPHMIQLANTLCAAAEMFIVSPARSDEVRAETMAWLSKHLKGVRLPESDVFMRRATDHRQDDVIKMEMLAEIRARGYEPIMAFEDRSSVVAMWRAAGVPCMQVAPGDF